MRRALLGPLAAIALSLWMLTASPSAQSAVGSADALFDGDTLHDVWIHINARDWEQLRATYQENTYYPCDVEWRGLKARNAGCRSRGSASRSAAKPGLRVEFDHYVTEQTFVGLTSLVLDNFWQDPSMMRERLSMLLFQRMGIPAPREAFTRLYVGSDRAYAGMYALVEDVDAHFLARQFGDGSGYLYEYQRQDDYRFEDLGADLEPYAVRFAPKTHEHESAFTLISPIRDMVHAITDAAASDLETRVAPLLDLRQVLTQLAVENYLSEWDGVLGDLGLSNFYLYRLPGQDQARMIPWDKDNTFSRIDMPPWHNVETNVLTAKAWAVPELRAFYLQKLSETAASGEWLEEEAGREYAQIHEAALADRVKSVSSAAFEEAAEDVNRFARERGGIIRRFLTGDERRQ